MNNEIVWIYGASAAGKETFIRKIVNEKPPKIIMDLGWDTKEIIVCEESIQWVGQYDNDPKINERKQIPNIVARYLENKNGCVILIKGQDVDLENNLPVQLYDSLPEGKHEIVFMKVDVERLYIRGQKKIWWQPENSLETSNNWLNYQMELLSKISNKLTIKAVDSNTEDYCLVEVPSNILLKLKD